jgi:hypothetical protein
MDLLLFPRLLTIILLIMATVTVIDDRIVKDAAASWLDAPTIEQIHEKNEERSES